MEKRNPPEPLDDISSDSCILYACADFPTNASVITAEIQHVKTV